MWSSLHHFQWTFENNFLINLDRNCKSICDKTANPMQYAVLRSIVIIVTCFTKELKSTKTFKGKLMQFKNYFRNRFNAKNDVS